jgi:hypothetical protein
MRANTVIQPLKKLITSQKLIDSRLAELCTLFICANFG